MKTIQVTIDTAGKVEIEAVGYRGTDCEQATAFLEQALGTTERKTRKSEFYRRACTKDAQRIGS